MGEISNRRGPESFSYRVCLATTVLVLSLSFFSGIWHGRNGVGGSPLPLTWCDYLMEISHSTGHFNLWVIRKIISS